MRYEMHIIGNLKDMGRANDILSANQVEPSCRTHLKQRVQNF